MDITHDNNKSSKFLSHVKHENTKKKIDTNSMKTQEKMLTLKFVIHLKMQRIQKYKSLV